MLVLYPSICNFNSFCAMLFCAQLLSWCLSLCDPMDCSTPGSPLHGDSPGRRYLSGLPCPSPGDLPNPGIEPRSPAVQVDCLLSEPPAKPMSTGVQPIPSSGNLPDLGIKLRSPALQADSLPAELPGKPSFKIGWAKLCCSLIQVYQMHFLF